MSKKRKPNEYQQQKIARAQHKKEFLAKIHSVIKIATAKKIYELIPQYILDSFYENRSLSLQIKQGEGQNIPAEMMKMLKGNIPILLKDENISYTSDNKQMSLYDFFTIYLSINSLYQIVEKCCFVNQNIVLDELEIFSQYKTLYKTVIVNMSNFLRRISYYISDFQNQIYYFDFNTKIISNKGAHFYNEVLIYRSKPEKTFIKIDKEYRPVVRLGFSQEFAGINWISIKPSELNLKNTFAELPHEVFIQSHAIVRLKERLDCMNDATIMYQLIYSLVKIPKLYYDKNNKMMLELKSDKARFGYLPIEITDGKIIIKTFLFVTNNTTPEGEMLEKYTGFQKEEKKYLGIDKLSTFMNSDIGTNVELQKFLRKSGCQCLIDLYEKHKNNFTVNTESHNLNKMMALMDKNMEYQKENEALVNTEF